MILFPIILAIVGLYMLIAWIVSTFQKRDGGDRQRRSGRRRRFARA